MTLTEEQLDNLKHMLGAQPHIKPHQWGFRNYFNASVGSPDEKAMLELVRLGYVVEGRRGTRDVYFHCTDSGIKAAGLTGDQLMRARGLEGIAR